MFILIFVCYLKRGSSRRSNLDGGRKPECPNSMLRELAVEGKATRKKEKSIYTKIEKVHFLISMISRFLFFPHNSEKIYIIQNILKTIRQKKLFFESTKSCEKKK
jgi:hypothetical protein